MSPATNRERKAAEHKAQRQATMFMVATCLAGLVHAAYLACTTL